MTNLEQTIDRSRGRLIGIAYRMLGCRSDAEDVVQDAYLRARAADLAAVRSLESYLVTIVTRLCLDHLKSARVQRETYVGPWLPEPVADADQLCPQSSAEIADDLSFALMLTLEKLSAGERAAFILHDVFDAPFAEVASALGKSEAACRQLAMRARTSIKADRPAKPVEPTKHDALLTKFVAAVGTGSTSDLADLLSEDVTVYSDGGGIKSAALVPLGGKDRVIRFLIGIKRKHDRSGTELRFEYSSINGATGLALYIDGALDQTLSIAIEQGHVCAIYIVRNPRKLRAFNSAHCSTDEHQ